MTDDSQPSATPTVRGVTTRWTTIVRTRDGKTYDLGAGERRPFHRHPGDGTCPACDVIDARTAPP